MDNHQIQAKAQELYKKLSQSPYFSEQTSNEYEQILQINPNHILALQKLGCIYNGDFDYEGNGSYWFEMKCANREKAIDCFTRIIQIDPKFSKAYQRLGSLYVNSNTEKALQYYLQYLNLNPQDYHAVGQVGHIYYLLNRKQEAKVYFTNCIQHIKSIASHQWALQGLAKVYESQQNFEAGLECLRKCLKMNPKNAETHAIFGHIHHKMGNMKGAIHAYLKCKQLKYDHKEALAYLDRHLKAYNQQQLIKGSKN